MPTSQIDEDREDLAQMIGRRGALRLGGALVSAATTGLHMRQLAAMPADASRSNQKSGMVPLPPGVTPTPVSERQVGVCYSTWHMNRDWDRQPGPNSPWGKPILGYYSSGNHDVIRKHAEWLSGAGVDFILVDWSNELGVDPDANTGSADKLFLERAISDLFAVYAVLPKKPKISIMLGDNKIFDDDHSLLQRKADQVYQLASDPKHSAIVETYLGKPLLVVFVGDEPQPRKPAWDDQRFTVRYMSAFLTSRSSAFHDGPVSRLGFWSWEDFGTPSFPIYDGHPEAANAVAAYRGRGSHGRQDGKTFITNWNDIRRLGPRFALAGTFNEWWIAEQGTPETSKDVEPSERFGFRYLDILRQQAALYKQGK